MGVEAGSPESANAFGNTYLRQLRQVYVAQDRSISTTVSAHELFVTNAYLHETLDANRDQFYETYRESHADEAYMYMDRALFDLAVFRKPIEDGPGDAEISSRSPTYVQFHTAVGQFINLKSNIQALVKASQIVASASEGHIQPIPDLSDAQRADVLQSYFDEWAKVRVLAIKVGRQSVGLIDNRRPLIRNGVAELESELARAESLQMSRRIIGYFFSRSVSFHEACDDAHESSIRTATASRLRIRSKRELELNQETEALTTDQRYSAFVTERNPEYILPVKDPDNVNDVVKALCGQFVTELAERYGGATGNVWGGRVTADFGALLRPKKFWGQLQNTRLVHLPMDEAYVEAYEADFKNDLARMILARIGVFTDMHSSGRGMVGESFQDIVIHTRDPEDPALRQVDASVRKNIHGDKVATYLNAESGSKATLEQIRNLSRPGSGGLPTLGKR